MSVHSGHHQTSTRTTTYHTTNAMNAVSSPEPLTSNITISAESVSPLPYALNGGNYETVRYLVPVQGNMQMQSVQQQACYYPIQQQQSMSYIPIQQQQQFIPIQQAQQQQSYYIMQQPQQQMLSPVYLQTLPRVSVSSHESDSVFNQTQTHTQVDETEVDGEDESEAEEEDNGDQEVVVDETVITTTISQNISSSNGDMTTDTKEMLLPEKMDPRYFGELLAEVYRKNIDIHSCIFEHVSKIRGQKHQLDPSNDYKVEKDEVESLLPKGSSELTKQQIRYLLQTRLVADKSMRLLLSTFSSLREELLRMSEDLRRLEMEKESLERDLSFKADQAQQYDLLLEAVRENNRQLQMSMKESGAAQRSLESQLSSSQSSSSSHEFMMQDLEGRLRALENENNMLKQQLASQGSSKSDMLAQTDALSRQFKDQLDALRREKDAEIARLRSEMSTFQSQSSQQSSSDQALQLKISELLAMLDKRQTTITTQEEELRRLRTEKSSWSSSNKNISKTTVNTSSSYTNRYPMLRLLSDDYEAKISSPRENRTFTFQKTG